MGIPRDRNHWKQISGLAWYIITSHDKDVILFYLSLSPLQVPDCKYLRGRTVSVYIVSQFLV